MMAITNQIRINNLRGDIFGGVTAAVVSLTLALALGVSSGVRSLYGLYGAVCVGFFAALFGGTPTSISKPTGSMTVSPVYRFPCNVCAVGVKPFTPNLFNSFKFI
jgi:sulfate permease, SulP family